jgi:myo-inositol catabolism protein IolC
MHTKDASEQHVRKDTRKQYLKRLFVGCRDPCDSGQKQSRLGILQDKKIGTEGVLKQERHGE